MALWRLYYHLVWATKNRSPLITSDIEPKLYDYIIGKADSLECITKGLIRYFNIFIFNFNWMP